MNETADGLMRGADLARRENRLPDAHRDLVEAVALCRQSGKPGSLIQALKKLGQIERDLGRGNAALPLYEEAVALCRDKSDPLLLAHTVRHLGDIHQDAGRVALAEPCYHEALLLYRGDEGTPPLDLANALRPLAILKEKTGDLDEARRLFAEARDLYAAIGVRAGVVECQARVARLDRRLGP